MKYLRILFLLVSPVIIDGMTCCDCPNSEKETANFSYCSLEVNYLDNTGEKPVLTQSTALPKEALGIRIDVERKRDMCINRRSWFGTAAYACDCGYDTIYFPLENIVKASIITVNDFDTQHPAGTDITEYFYTYDSRSYKPATTEFSTQLKYVNYYSGELSNEINFLLMTPPPSMTECAFKIVVELSDERILEDTTDTILLQ